MVAATACLDYEILYSREWPSQERHVDIWRWTVDDPQKIPPADRLFGDHLENGVDTVAILDVGYAECRYPRAFKKELDASASDIVFR